jgi:hypothetical protein
LRKLLRFGSIIALALGLASAHAADSARDSVNAVLRTAGGTAGQARALVRLAWIEPGVDPAVSSLARNMIVKYGEAGLPALREAATEVPLRFTADVVVATIEARMRERTGVPRDYLAGLEKAIWFGSIHAKRLAIARLSGESYRPVVMACIDAAHDHPELTETVLRALVSFREPTSRFYLDESLRTGTLQQRRLAAIALSLIGGPAHELLREASLSDDSKVQDVAVAALIPVSGPEDLTIFYEFVDRYAGDGHPLLEEVSRRAAELEALRESQQDQDAASSTAGGE